MNSECRQTGGVASIRTFNSGITFGMVFPIAWLIFALSRFFCLSHVSCRRWAYDNARNLEVALSVNADCAVFSVAADRLDPDAAVANLAVVPLERNLLCDSCYHKRPRFLSPRLRAPRRHRLTAVNTCPVNHDLSERPPAQLSFSSSVPPFTPVPFRSALRPSP